MWWGSATAWKVTIIIYSGIDTKLNKNAAFATTRQANVASDSHDIGVLACVIGMHIQENAEDAHLTMLASMLAYA